MGFQLKIGVNSVKLPNVQEIHQQQNIKQCALSEETYLPREKCHYS
jgi:hypothetical protein